MFVAGRRARRKVSIMPRAPLSGIIHTPKRLFEVVRGAMKPPGGGVEGSAHSAASVAERDCHRATGSVFASTITPETEQTRILDLSPELNSKVRVPVNLVDSNDLGMPCPPGDTGTLDQLGDDALIILPLDDEEVVLEPHQRASIRHSARWLISCSLNWTPSGLPRSIRISDTSPEARSSGRAIAARA